MLSLGPQCYVQPSIKSNKRIISNAISHICLAGAVNTDARQKVIQVCRLWQISVVLIIGSLIGKTTYWLHFQYHTVR